MVLKKKAVTTRRRIEYVPPAWVVRGFAIEAEGTVLDAPHVATVLKRVMTEDTLGPYWKKLELDLAAESRSIAIVEMASRIRFHVQAPAMLNQSARTRIASEMTASMETYALCAQQILQGQNPHHAFRSIWPRLQRSGGLHWIDNLRNHLFEMRTVAASVRAWADSGDAPQHVSTPEKRRASLVRDLIDQLRPRLGFPSASFVSQVVNLAFDDLKDLDSSHVAKIMSRTRGVGF